ncbi:mono/diheme cytochrome c family protein [Caldalkalibacillus uzonensis]|uniref:Mono/diheme cytochrome c family protein n=1 Tax=Caldalkalibacillus uzonensis TaxID=353224 RepID=A0ABU0CRE9_9BACI|nr:electron transport protein [Caldalkalibacillus uzonensis]MDQ0337592.1 mono/diheme cytochrome c family protein [Caldalkalibacillus uzonensis]
MKWLLRGAVFVVFLLGLIVIVTLYVVEPRYAYMPPENNIIAAPGQYASLANEDRGVDYGYDLWGQFITREESQQLLQTEEGQALLAPENGAVRVDDQLVRLGREMFYKETFGNEVFLTDILGLLDGPLTLQNIMRAIMELKGEGTDNLQVELAETVKIGDKIYRKGTKIDTGLDVPKGSYTPLGMPITLSEGRVRVGISCAACHATVDRETGMVVEGAPNSNLNAGLLLALASNSAAYLTNTEIEALQNYIRDEGRTVETSAGKKVPLPDPYELEKAVDEVLASWPPGNFDSTMDLTANPAQIPDSFTWGDHPYGWSGFAFAGPFNGLSSLNNNVHAQNSDLLAQYEQSESLFGIDKEVYIGTILQNAANPKFRYRPESGQKPSEFFKEIDPTPGFVGINENIKPPTFPNVSFFTPNGTIVSSPGYHVGEQINALSAYQNGLRAPEPKIKLDRDTVQKGREVFRRAGCISCHAGPAYTNNRVISAGEIQTEPTRAKAFKGTQKIMKNPVIYPPNTPVPVPENASVLEVPIDHVDPEQIKLAYAYGTDGGYKVKGLVGLYWSAPYLHDGGVAVGPDPDQQVGLTGTLLKGIKPDPENSLRALVNRSLRAKVIEANRRSPQLQQARVTGSGHHYWVDEEAGFTPEEQEALIQYLISLNEPEAQLSATENARPLEEE